MEGNAKGTMSADVLMASKEIIVKLVEDLHNAQPAQEHAEMERVNLIIRVFVSLVGLENCAIRTSHGLESKNIFSLVVLVCSQLDRCNKISYLT